MGSKSNMKSI